MSLAIYANSYGEFNGGAEVEIDCQGCGLIYEVEFDWDGEFWVARHNIRVVEDGINCTTEVVRDRSEWQKCPYCAHVNALETTSDPDDPTRDVPTPKPSPFFQRATAITEAYGRAYRQGVM